MTQPVPGPGHPSIMPLMAVQPGVMPRGGNTPVFQQSQVYTMRNTGMPAANQPPWATSNQAPQNQPMVNLQREYGAPPLQYGQAHVQPPPQQQMQQQGVHMSQYQAQQQSVQQQQYPPHTTSNVSVTPGWKVGLYASEQKQQRNSEPLPPGEDREDGHNDSSGNSRQQYDSHSPSYERGPAPHENKSGKRKGAKGRRRERRRQEREQREQKGSSIAESSIWDVVTSIVSFPDAEKPEGNSWQSRQGSNERDSRERNSRDRDPREGGSREQERELREREFRERELRERDLAEREVREWRMREQERELKEQEKREQQLRDIDSRKQDSRERELRERASQVLREGPPREKRDHAGGRGRDELRPGDSRRGRDIWDDKQRSGGSDRGSDRKRDDSISRGRNEGRSGARNESRSKSSRESHRGTRSQDRQQDSHDRPRDDSQKSRGSSQKDSSSRNTFGQKDDITEQPMEIEDDDPAAGSSFQNTSAMKMHFADHFPLQKSMDEKAKQAADEDYAKLCGILTTTEQKRNQGKGAKQKGEQKKNLSFQWTDKSKTKGEFRCTICSLNFTTQALFIKHCLTSEHLEKLKVIRTKDEALLEEYNRSRSSTKNKASAESGGRSGTGGRPGAKGDSTREVSGRKGAASFMGPGLLGEAPNLRQRGPNQQGTSQAGGVSATLSNQELSMIEALANQEHEGADLLTGQQPDADPCANQQQALMPSLNNPPRAEMGNADVHQQGEGSMMAESAGSQANQSDTPSTLTETDLLQCSHIPGVTENEMIGQNYIIPVTGFFCKVCSKFFNSKKLAFEVHCRSNKHHTRTITRNRHENLQMQNEMAKANRTAIALQMAQEAGNIGRPISGNSASQKGQEKQNVQAGWGGNGISSTNSMASSSSSQVTLGGTRITVPERPRDQRLTEVLLKEELMKKITTCQEEAQKSGMTLARQQEIKRMKEELQKHQVHEEQDRQDREIKLHQRLLEEKQKSEEKAREMQILEMQMREEQRKIDQLRVEEMQLEKLAERERQREALMQQKMRQERLLREQLQIELQHEEQLRVELLLQDQLRAEEVLFKERFAMQQKLHEEALLAKQKQQQKVMEAQAQQERMLKEQLAQEEDLRILKEQEQRAIEARLALEKRVKEQEEARAEVQKKERERKLALQKKIKEQERVRAEAEKKDKEEKKLASEKRIKEQAQKRAEQEKRDREQRKMASQSLMSKENTSSRTTRESSSRSRTQETNKNSGSSRHPQNRESRSSSNRDKDSHSRERSRSNESRKSSRRNSPAKPSSSSSTNRNTPVPIRSSSRLSSQQQTPSKTTVSLGKKSPSDKESLEGDDFEGDIGDEDFFDLGEGFDVVDEIIG